MRLSRRFGSVLALHFKIALTPSQLVGRVFFGTFAEDHPAGGEWLPPLLRGVLVRLG
jgi:hypothetical protein